MSFVFRLGTVLVATICMSALSSAQPSPPLLPPVPFEDVGACPFEGCVYREWVANAPLDVRTARQATGPIAFRVTKGETVTALTGVVVTLRPGRVQFSKATDLETSGGNIRVIPGQSLYLLTYQGEGYTKAWFNGRMYEGVDTQSFFNGLCRVAPTQCTGKIVESSRTVWWVQIRNAAGKIGWTRESEKFDGKDRYGR